MEGITRDLLFEVLAGEFMSYPNVTHTNWLQLRKSLTCNEKYGQQHLGK